MPPTEAIESIKKEKTTTKQKEIKAIDNLRNSNLIKELKKIHTKT